MKELLKKLGEMFLDTNGKVSFKRVTGSISFLSALVMGFLKYDIGIIGVFTGYAAAAIGFSLGEPKKSAGDEK